MAGAEMLAAKQRLPHGQFGAWLENLKMPSGKGISNGTAHNYMNLAERLQEKLSTLPKGTMAELMPALKGEQEGAQTALAILNLPDPLDVFNPAHDRIAKIIHHVTSGASLRQLYFDWGIVPQPKPVVPFKETPPDLEPGETLAHHDAVETFDAIFAQLWREVRDFKQHLHLELADLNRYSTELMDLRRQFDDLKNRG